MCLSTAYENEKVEEKIIMKNVQSVQTEGDYIILTDLMERIQKIKGTIEKIDLMENYVIIKKID